MLTQAKVKNAKPGKHADGGGLTLLVDVSGTRLWRFRYRYAGKENTLGFGKWPEVSIADARRLRDEARAKLRNGINPSAAKREARAAAEVASRNTFAAVAEDSPWRLRDAAMPKLCLEEGSNKQGYCCA